MAISVIKFMVSNDLSTIDLKIEVNPGQTVNEILFWDEKSYRDPNNSIDLTNLTEGSTNVEEFSIGVNSAEVTSFTGMYFVQITASDGSASVVATFNLTQYYSVQAKLIANIDLSCLNCNSNFQNALLFDMYLEATKQALIIGRYQDAIDNLSKLIITVDISSCEECNDIAPAVSSAGNIVSVGVIDCIITES